MIISDRHRFILVHIPKCAGVSVKRALRPIDDSHGHYSRIADHPALGRIHWAHIPLRDLSDHFADVSAKLRSYCCVALVRHPVDRFVSAMFQRLREFKGADQSAITPDLFIAEALPVARRVGAGSSRLPLEYVHFIRQRDFIFDGEQQVVANVFRVDQLELAADFIAERTGIRIAYDERSNRSVEFNAGPLRPLVRLIRAPYARVVPIGVRQRTRSALVRAGFYRDLSPSRFVLPGSYLHDFVREHYAADFEIFESARGPQAIAGVAA